MKERKEGHTQNTASAKAGISVRSGRRIDTGELTVQCKPQRHWITREDPLLEVWDSELVPLLEANPALLPMTLFEHLNDNYPDRYDDKILRTLQRRVKSWKALHGPSKEVMFRQSKVPGRLALSDFTKPKGITITLKGVEFSHLLYHYRLAFSGWCYVKVVCGGESFTALSTGLQDAFWRSGGVPQEHRTDSLSAAFNNQAEKEVLTSRYENVCKYYRVKATRNNPGISHENGAIESPHGHLKRRIKQALLLRGSSDFESLEEYQVFIDGVVAKINRRCHTRFQEERQCLQALPKRRTQDYAEHQVLVTSSSTFDLKRVTYSVPSRFIGERLYIQLFDDRLKVFYGHQEVLELVRLYPTRTQRVKNIDYRHLIDSLVRKPQAFRFSNIRDDILPSPDYKRIWEYVDTTLPPHKACNYIVRILHLAAKMQCEGALGRYILSYIDRDELPSDIQCSKRFGREASTVPDIMERQHELEEYDQLIAFSKPQKTEGQLYV